MQAEHHIITSEKTSSGLLVSVAPVSTLTAMMAFHVASVH